MSANSPNPQPAREPIRIPLTQLLPGRRAVVECASLDALPQGERCLLSAMGLSECCEVRMCKGGHACIVQVESTRLGLSQDVASRIMVTPIDEST